MLNRRSACNNKDNIWLRGHASAETAYGHRREVGGEGQQIEERHEDRHRRDKQGDVSR
jgi:hypothetical protein